MAKMTKAERETTIQWSEADKIAHVFTASRPISSRIARIVGGKQVAVSRGPAGEWWGEEWELPIPCVMPRQKRQGKAPNRAQLAGLQKARSMTGKKTQTDHSGEGET